MGRWGGGGGGQGETFDGELCRCVFKMVHVTSRGEDACGKRVFRDLLLSA